MTNIDYTLWPNTDGELGKIKVAIPTNAEDWPAGDALVGNFVYNDGKLAGFVDTKALILNESATTTFPYDYVDIYLSSIQEGTLTVNRGERCKYLNVKFYNDKWLPTGFTELDFLESSGTQYIDTCDFLDSEWSVTITAANTAPNNNNNSFGLFGFNSPAPLRFALSVYCEESTHRNVAWVGLGDFGEMFLSWDIDTSLFHTYSLDKSMLTFDGSPAFEEEIQTAPFSNSTYTSFLFKYNSTTQNGFIGRVTSAILYQGNSKKRDFRPVLDADGIPCMYDTVSHTCFRNQGTGTFGYRIKATGDYSAPLSLRDPYYVAPSGVYAKLITENELEIVADTEEVQGDNWVHFANTSEAYEHFGITFEDATLV